MVLNIDFAPTMLAIGGVDIPSRMQGHDIGPLLRNESIEWRSEWYYEHTYSPPWHRRPIAETEGVRTDRWKYIRYLDPNPVYEQLFDLQSDPGERQNLVSLPQYAETLADMRARQVRLASEAR